jgi:hypothetical protein
MVKLIPAECLLQKLEVALNPETQALFEPNRAEHPRGIVDEADRVQDAYQPLTQVSSASPRVEQLAEMASVEAEGEGVDGEVAAMQIELDAAAGDGGQGRRVSVELRTSGYEIKTRRKGPGRQSCRAPG